jgi:molybdenum cofactor synthesis domain-containing protein
VSVERAFVLTVSDGVAAGVRTDESGEVLAERLAGLGWAVDRAIVPDGEDPVSAAVADAARDHRLIVATGGTGLGPRDRTPQALDRVLDYVIAGFGEVMRAEGRRSTRLADLSRSLAGAIGSTLVIAVPGSPRAALESLAAVEPLLEHALETLAGRTQAHPPHGVNSAGGAEVADGAEGAGGAQVPEGAEGAGGAQVPEGAEGAGGAQVPEGAETAGLDHPGLARHPGTPE